MYALNLKGFCKERKLTLSELAFKSGIPQPSLSRYDHGKSDITLRQLNRLIISLGVKIEDVLEEKKSFVKKFSHAIVNKEKQIGEKEWVSRLLWNFRQHYLKVKNK